MKNTIAFIRGIPPVESFPKEKLVKCAGDAIINHGDQILQYAGAGGYDPLRRWIADRHQADLESVILGQGSLQLLDFYIHSCLKAGDLIYVEQPTYDRTLTLFKRACMQIKGFNLVKDVINPIEVEQSLKNGVVPKAFYIIPDFQNPSGAIMPLVQRKKLLKLAEQYDFLIIEDGPYRHLRYSGEHLPTLYELDPSHVLHMSSFSKMVSPGLRVGYMVGKDKIVSSIRQYAEDSSINSSYLNQAMIYEFIRNGWLENHIESIITLYRSRLNAMLDSLEAFIGNKGEWLEPQGGFFAGLTLNRNVNIPDTQTCKTAGIALSNSQGFFLDGGENYLRLPFCALTPDEIRTGVQRLASLL